MSNAYVISGETANKITELLSFYQGQAREAGDGDFANNLAELTTAVNNGKAPDVLASVAIEEIASGTAAYCIWVDEELNGCPHDAVTDIAKVAGDRVIDDFVIDAEDE